MGQGFKRSSPTALVLLRVLKGQHSFRISCSREWRDKHLQPEGTAQPRVWWCARGWPSPEGVDRPLGRWEERLGTLFHPEILYHHLTPVAGRKKENCVPGSNRLNPVHGTHDRQWHFICWEMPLHNSLS